MDQTPKQQIIETLKAAESIVVTTAQSPTVDQAASVIALTEMLRDVKKKAVAAFDPSVNEQTSFLEPDKFADPQLTTVRDFIIEIDESDAQVDQFRYDRKDKQLRIYITPKQGSFAADDVTTTEGDFNVDTLVTLGVSKQRDLFTTVARHNDLISNTKVVSLSSGALRSNIPGATTWHEDEASSIAELLVGVGEALGADLSKQISTALLTGIMAETKNFTNDKTSPKVMTMAAQLMAAGADQQSIVKNLQVPSQPKPDEQPQPQSQQTTASEQPEPAQKQPNADLSQSMPDQQASTQEQQTEASSQPSIPQPLQSQPQQAKPRQPQHKQPPTPPSPPKPTEPQDIPRQEQERSQSSPPVSEQAEDVSKQDSQVQMNPPKAPQQPQPEDSGQGQGISQARDAIEQALAGSGPQQASPQQQNQHPMIKTDRTYNPNSESSGQDPSQSPQSHQPKNPFNSVNAPEEENANDNPIL